MIYALAGHRAYTATSTNGAATAEDDKLDRLKKGAEASKSLSGGGGKGEENTTLQKLADWPEGDPEGFDREWNKAARLGLLG